MIPHTESAGVEEWSTWVRDGRIRRSVARDFGVWLFGRLYHQDLEIHAWEDSLSHENRVRLICRQGTVNAPIPLIMGRRVLCVITYPLERMMSYGARWESLCTDEKRLMFMHPILLLYGTPGYVDLRRHHAATISFNDVAATTITPKTTFLSGGERLRWESRLLREKHEAFYYTRKERALLNTISPNEVHAVWRRTGMAEMRDTGSLQRPNPFIPPTGRALYQEEHESGGSHESSSN